MTIEEEIFKKSEFITERLIEYGFTKEKEIYEYKKNILNDSFQVIITIINNKIIGKIIDLELNDEYLNFRVENQVGEFSNKIKEEFINILKDIKDKCCIEKVFISNQSNRIADIIKKEYNDIPEFIFEDKTIGVFRNKNNKKWYGIIMYIDYNKLEEKEGKVEVLNIKLEPDKISNLIQQDGFFRAYHMNKKTWISITLDDRVKDSVILELLRESYEYTIDTKEWIIPANPNYFDIISYMSNKEIVEWKQTSNIKINDIVYIYVAAPISAILYKTKAIEVDIPNKKENVYVDVKKKMKLKILKRYSKDLYTFNKVKEYGLKAVRGPRKMPKKLLDKMKEDEVVYEKN